MYADTVKQFDIEHGLTENNGIDLSADVTNQLVGHLNDLGIEAHGSKDMEEDLRRRRNKSQRNAFNEKGLYLNDNERFEGDNAVGRNNGGRVSEDSARAAQARNDLGDIRSYTEGLSDEQGRDPEISERKLREEESERLINVARQNGQFIPQEQYGDFGEQGGQG